MSPCFMTVEVATYGGYILLAIVALVAGIACIFCIQDLIYEVDALKSRISKDKVVMHEGGTNHLEILARLEKLEKRRGKRK